MAMTSPSIGIAILHFSAGYSLQPDLVPKLWYNNSRLSEMRIKIGADALSSQHSAQKMGVDALARPLSPN
jgi:hypothetical protein